MKSRMSFDDWMKAPDPEADAVVVTLDAEACGKSVEAAASEVLTDLLHEDAAAHGRVAA